MPDQPQGFRELNNDELEKLLNPPAGFNELDEGIMHRAWRIANTPLTTLPSKAMQAITSIPQAPENEALAEKFGVRPIFDFQQRMTKGGLNLVGALGDELTTPLNLATMGTGAAENIAGRYGLKGAELGLNLATKALSAPVAVEGAHKIYSEPTIGGKAMGALEMGGGALGMMHGPFGFKMGREAVPVAEAGEAATGGIARPPVIGYHGTPNLQEVLDKGFDTSKGTGQLPGMIHFAEDPNRAESFLTRGHTDRPVKGGIIPAELDIQNPIDVNNLKLGDLAKLRKGITDPKVMMDFDNIIKVYKGQVPEYEIMNLIRRMKPEEFKNTGFDAVKYNETNPLDPSQPPHVNWAVPDTSQIKGKYTGEQFNPATAAEKTPTGVPTKRNLKIQPDGNFLDKDTGELFNSKGEKVGEVETHRTAETGQFRKKMSYDPKTGTYLDKTTGDVYNAQGEKIGSTKPPADIPQLTTRPIPTLPSDLAGAKPRYNRGLDVYHPQFANDIDKALYIIAQAKGSKRDADYMAWLVEHTGLDETMLRGLAQEFKDHVKGILRYEKPGTIDIPSLHDPQKLLKGKVASAASTPLPATATGGLGQKPPMPPGVSPTGLPPAGGPPPPPIPEAVPAGTVLKPPPPKPAEVASKFSEVFNLAKGLMSWDYPFVTSAAFRQGSYHAFSKKWFLGWKNAARAYGEQAAYDEINKGIENMRSFKRTLEPMRTATGKLIRDPITGEIKTKINPSLADKIGLDLPDLKSLKTREEMIGSQLAEKAPLIGGLIKRSNRAYTAFLNTVRAHALEQIRDGLMTKGIDIEKDIATGKQVADFINTTTGRAPLKMTVGVPFSQKYSKEISWEKGADVLNGLMFSPRNYMSSVRMLDPLTYTNAAPGVRSLYVKAMLRKASAWSAMTMLGSMVGGSVNLNPTNSDFMKVRFGNKRIDPGGGLQQFLVLLARTAPFIGANGMSTTDRFGRDVFHKFGQGYKPETALTTAFHFAVNHAHPVLGTIAGMFDATEHRPVYPVDDVIKKMVPMFSADVLDVVNEDPSLTGLIQGLAMGTVSSAGMGAQTYDRQSTPSFSAIPGGQYHYPLKRRER